MAMAMDPEAEQKMKEKQAALKEECSPLLRKSFEHHNPSGSGTLSPEEAGAFFDHLVHEEGDFIRAVAGMVMTNVVAGMMNMMQQMVPEEQRPEMESQIRTQMEAAKTQMEEQIAKATADYEADRAAKNAAAFAIIDKNGDRTIQLDEFVAAMDFEGDKSKDFQKALGFDESTMGGKGGGKGCPMQ